MGFWRRLLGMNRDSYQLQALVSSRAIEPTLSLALKTHVVCDIDKTYIETEFESWVKMARIPFERPHEKITVAGASEVLQELRWSAVKEADSPRDLTPNVGLHFVSSSPPQLRAALEGKLVLDNLDWTSDTFKNQSYNLRMARIDLLRHHIAYKTKAILDVVKRIPESSEIWLIGDNAEYDGFIYMGVKLFLDRVISVNGLGEWMAASQVEKVVMDQVLASVSDVQERGSKVKGILIRRLPNYPLVEVKPCSQDMYMFDSWLQVAWIWMLEQVISQKSLWKLVRSFHNVHGVSLPHVMSCLSPWISDETLKGSPISHELRDAARAVYQKLGDQEIKAEKKYSWTFDRYSLMEPRSYKDIDTSDLAKIWYRNIESARALRHR